MNLTTTKINKNTVTKDQHGVTNLGFAIKTLYL